MAFNINNFSFIGGSELGAEKLPLLFNYYAGDDSIDDILNGPVVHYFGLGLNEPGANERDSITNIVTFGSLINVVSNVPSGAPGVEYALLVVGSQTGYDVEVDQWTPYTP